MRRNSYHLRHITYSRVHGFTLIELLIVISIIGILSAIAAASFITTQKQARDARRINDMKAVQNGWELYFGDNSENYPGSTLTVPCSLTLMSSPVTYLPGGFPQDPKANSSFYPDKDGWSRCSSTSYCFCAGIELSKNKNSAVDCIGGTSADYPNGFYCVHNVQ